ncbi:MAG: methyltransferase domain-containing protein [Nocardioidaceae bacterium]|nr:methyltransferase domain-containing protein [Nocardioidaceae bacterium]
MKLFHRLAAPFRAALRGLSPVMAPLDGSAAYPSPPELRVPEELKRAVDEESRRKAGIFEAIYAGAEGGGAKPPWDYGAVRPQLREWAEARNLAGGGREALVVGCGYGSDAEYLAQLGFRTTAFDFSPTAIAAARRQHPGSEVDYFVADVLDLPGDWLGRFDLVVESLTVQSMPPDQHSAAARSIAALVAPGGTLLVLATTRDEGAVVQGPPWPLTRAELDDFAQDDLTLRQVERIADGTWWGAELSRDSS